MCKYSICIIKPIVICMHRYSWKYGICIFTKYAYSSNCWYAYYLTILCIFGLRCNFWMFANWEVVNYMRYAAWTNEILAGAWSKFQLKQIEEEKGINWEQCSRCPFPSLLHGKWIRTPQHSSITLSKPVVTGNSWIFDCLWSCRDCKPNYGLWPTDCIPN